MKTYHLKLVGSDWTLSLEGDNKPLISKAEKEDVVNEAVQFMQRTRGTLIIHRGPGEIEEYFFPASC